MSRVVLRIPVLLEPVVGTVKMELAGGTIAEVLEGAFEAHPVLRHHIMNDDGILRPHILCMHNGANVGREPLAEIALADGDELEIMQAISGG